MKKLLSIMLVSLILIALLASCSKPVNIDKSTDTNTDTNENTNIGENLEGGDTENDNVNEGENPDSGNTKNDNNNEGEKTEGGDTGNDNTIDTSIKVEYDAEREASDNEFPFDNIVVERNGYDIVSAGKYYGDDFDNVKYYGSYYRIIDNYNDFSELTAWGNKIDESLFDDNFILVLFTYKNYDVYYSRSEFYELNEKGEFRQFKVDMSTGLLNIIESWSIGAATPDREDYVPLDYKDYKTVFPVEKREILYLLIPKNELDNNLSINGEINLKTKIMVDE